MLVDWGLETLNQKCVRAYQTLRTTTKELVLNRWSDFLSRFGKKRKESY